MGLAALVGRDWAVGLARQHNLIRDGSFLHEFNVFFDQIQTPVRAPMSRNMNTLTMNTGELAVVQLLGQEMGSQLG